MDQRTRAEQTDLLLTVMARTGYATPDAIEIVREELAILREVAVTADQTLRHEAWTHSPIGVALDRWKGYA